MPKPYGYLRRSWSALTERIFMLARLPLKELRQVFYKDPFTSNMTDLVVGGVLLTASLVAMPRGVGILPILFMLAAFLVFSRSIFTTLYTSLAPSDTTDLHSTIEHLYRDRRILSEQIDELATIREVSLAVNTILDFDQMIHSILDLTTNSLDVAKALIYVRSQDEAALEVVGARSNGRDINPNHVLQRKVPFGVGLVGQAAAEKREIVAAHSEKGLVVAVPLLMKNRVVGVLKLTDTEAKELAPERRRKLLAVASAMAVALENARLYRLAVTDGLTGLYVHRHFQHRLEEEFVRSRRYGSPLALLLTDIDHFKKFNDTYGHTTGDEVLRGVARILEDVARVTDVVARYGGEEMAIICPHTDLAGAMQVAERIRSAVESARFRDTSGEREISVTISIGVAVYLTGMENRTVLIERSDEALYIAKNEGRNRVRTLEPWSESRSAV